MENADFESQEEELLKASFVLLSLSKPRYNVQNRGKRSLLTKKLSTTFSIF